MKLTQLACAALMMTGSAALYAKPIWQDFSVTGLYGENYEVVDKKETTITLEYAAKVKYADVFFLWIACVAATIIKAPTSSYHLVLA